MQHIHLEVFSKVNNIKLYNPTLVNMIKPYKMSENYNFFKAYIYNFLFKILSLTYKLTKKLNPLKIIDFDSSQNEDAYIQLLKTKKNVFVRGWAFRDYENVLKYKDYFRNLFTPIEPIKPEVLERFNNTNIKIGVHIRRGDYKEWQGGKFYYKDDEYIKIIKKTIDLLKQPVSLYFFSNENLDKDVYKKEFGENIYFSDNPYYIDHFLMSDCDYLIGPPSSFTDFASFIGKAKFYHIHDINKEFTLDDFKPSRG